MLLYLQLCLVAGTGLESWQAVFVSLRLVRTVDTGVSRVILVRTTNSAAVHSCLGLRERLRISPSPQSCQIETVL